MLARNAVEAAVFEMLADKLQIRHDKITIERSVNVDLGMDGDDAVEFFEELGERYNLDLRPLGEEWDRYFAPEGVAFVDTNEILTLFTARSPSRGRAEPLLLSRVIDAVLDGRWTPGKETK